LTDKIVRDIHWYLERYVRPVRTISGTVAKGVTVGVLWGAQLRYLSGCVVGSLLLERAGVRILPLAKQVQFDPLRDDDPERDLYLAYVAEAKILWDAFVARMADEVVKDEEPSNTESAIPGVNQ
jgi:hypothetical protein